MFRGQLLRPPLRQHKLRRCGFRDKQELTCRRAPVGGLQVVLKRDRVKNGSEVGGGTTICKTRPPRARNWTEIGVSGNV